MKQNKYDNPEFFNQYSQMQRSLQGLEGAGEWHVLKKVLPDFKDKRVLDLGCGFGWHCRYAASEGATSVIGIDISEKMLEMAKNNTESPNVKYIRMPIEDINFEPDSFDIVISSLAFHYISSFDDICRKVNNCLSKGGDFIFSVEHPVFTAYGTQDWHHDDEGNRLHWPVDNYFKEGLRETNFLGEDVFKYHKTLTTYINGLLENGFSINALIEPEPSESLLDISPDMKDELRRPIFLIIAATKNN